MNQHHLYPLASPSPFIIKSCTPQAFGLSPRNI